MVLEYLNFRKSKDGVQTIVSDAPNSPILNDEDEKFLERLTSEAEGKAPPLPERPVVIFDTGEKVVGKDAQIALMNGAEKVPLPQSPPAVTPFVAPNSAENKASQKAQEYLSYVRNLPQRFTNKGKEKEKAGSDLQAAVKAAKQGETVSVEGVVTDENEKTKEEQDLTAVLDQLNLGAVNNRAFSFSEKSQQMMAEFTQILKDIVNGVPTAYDDLEGFLKNWDEHLRKLYGDLPPFLQNLVKSLPAKLSSTIAPGLLAAASEKPGFDAKTMGIKTASGSATKRKRRIPSLKKLISSQATVTGMLRSILNFLKLRFPAVITGTNVLMSLAVFLLLFVFWYCHKRGKETRLEKERLAADDAEEDSDVDQTSSELEESAVLDDQKDFQKILGQPAPAAVPLPAPTPT